jgi:hypothetical protein
MLLSLTVALNASQVMVLCLGCDGHVAVEPVGHSHDDCGDHTHPDESGTAFSPVAEGASCRGCIDIPLPNEIPNSSSASDGSKIVSAAMADVAPAGLAMENGNAPAGEAAAPGFLSPYHIPLRSIVLQV